MGNVIRPVMKNDMRYEKCMNGHGCGNELEYEHEYEDKDGDGNGEGIPKITQGVDHVSNKRYFARS